TTQAVHHVETRSNSHHGLNYTARTEHSVTGVSDSDAVRDLLTRVNMLEEQVEDGDGRIPASLIQRFRNKAVETLADESAQRIIPVLSTIYVLLGLPPLTA
ncbi:hypothetical protein AB0M33_11095, partial [Micrococcus luteus]|uniref:hypothetical protein n=2 Tax=Micrococcus luteus TaxID=1270 RepID=UPI0033C9C27F